jgi:hypothetical protein
MSDSKSGTSARLLPLRLFSTSVLFWHEKFASYSVAVSDGLIRPFDRFTFF